MGKIKSAIALALITILIAGLCFMSTASFSYDDGIHMFNSFLVDMEKDANLGNALPDGFVNSNGESYIGGGYTAVYYPEGVISAQKYENDLKGFQAAGNDDKAEGHVAKYAPYGSVYFDKEVVYGEDSETETVSEEFETSFQNAVCVLRARLEGLHVEGARLEVRDDYTVQIYLPAYASGTAVILNYFTYMGEFSVRYGSSQDTAATFPMEEGETINDYVKGARTRSQGGVEYVGIRFTKKGQAALASMTSGAADSSANLYFCVGENAVITLQSVNQKLNERTLWISGSYTAETASAVALVIDSSVNGAATELALNIGDVVRNEASFGNTALVLLYVAFALLFAGMLVFFFVRYRLLGLANLYTSLVWLLAMIVLVWAIPFLHLGVETFLAVALGCALLAVSNVITFEKARKEYALGRTVTFSVKAAYKKSFWQIFDLHVVIALFAFITYFIALTELSVFAFTLGLGVALSGLCTFAVNRFHWAAFMSFAGTGDRKKAAFCNFKREEEDDE